MASTMKDKVAIVTGSSSGIGEAIALLFASRGASVTLCGRDREKLKLVLDKVLKVNGGHQNKVLTVQGDVNDEKIRKQVIDQTVEKFGRLDILVPNAGISQPNQTVESSTEEVYDNMMDTNVKAVFFLIQRAIPYLEKSKGNIITTGSLSAEMAVPDVTIYALSKIAIDHLTRCLAVELGPKGIRVNGVRAGFIASNITRDYGEFSDLINKEILKIELSRQPLKTSTVTAEGLAEVVAFLVSETASFITGQMITLDSGRSLMGPIDWSVLKPKA